MIGLRRFHQLGSHLFQEIPPLLGPERLDQVLLSGGQNAFQADHEKIAEQVGVNILGAVAHALLRKAAHSPADGGFDFS